jgi:peptidyl-prolyl cis-trans isomerase SurA
VKTPLLFLLVLGANLAVAQDKLLDKIGAVVNGRVYSLSEVIRVEQTLPARREIAPFIYTEASYEREHLLDLIIRSQIVRDKIGAQGYVVSDDSVESRIRMTEEKLGLNRESLLAFLQGKGLTYEEYFEVMRESMEYSLFATRIIAPMVSITEQELKNEFYKRHVTDKALSFTYNLVDFSVPESQARSNPTDLYLQALKDYQLTGRLGGGYSDLEANPIEGVREDGLHPSIASALAGTPEGSFTTPVVIGGRLRSFYVKKKDIAESQAYLRAKDGLGEEIFAEKSKSLTRNWFEREYPNYYIKKTL